MKLTLSVLRYALVITLIFVKIALVVVMASGGSAPTVYGGF